MGYRYRGGYRCGGFIPASKISLGFARRESVVAWVIEVNQSAIKSFCNYTSIALSVDTQITTQAAKKLLSIRVSNFMAVLRE
jgi:hypothetical protein